MAMPHQSVRHVSASLYQGHAGQSVNSPIAQSFFLCGERRTATAILATKKKKNTKRCVIAQQQEILRYYSMIALFYPWCSLCASFCSLSLSLWATIQRTANSERIQRIQPTNSSDEFNQQIHDDQRINGPQNERLNERIIGPQHTARRVVLNLLSVCERLIWPALIYQIATNWQLFVHTVGVLDVPMIRSTN